ncbi:hypothetical protein HG531_007994 [Fusarium graminearum]|nr:hypothetical protein HG531_007994 [Fusarium graminearum]
MVAALGTEPRIASTGERLLGTVTTGRGVAVSVFCACASAALATFVRLPLGGIVRLARRMRSAASAEGERDPLGLLGPATSIMRAECTLEDLLSRKGPPVSESAGEELPATDTRAEVNISAFSYVGSSSAVSCRDWMRLVMIFDNRWFFFTTGSGISSFFDLSSSASFDGSVLLCSALSFSDSFVASLSVAFKTGTPSFERFTAARYGEAPGVGSEFERFRPVKSGVLGCDTVGTRNLDFIHIFVSHWKCNLRWLNLSIGLFFNIAGSSPAEGRRSYPLLPAPPQSPQCSVECYSLHVLLFHDNAVSDIGGVSGSVVDLLLAFRPQSVVCGLTRNDNFAGLLIGTKLKVFLFHVEVLVFFFHVAQRRVDHASKTGALPNQFQVPVARFVALRRNIILLVAFTKVFTQFLISVVHGVFR